MGAREETIYIDALVNLINGGSWQKAKKEAVGYRGLAVSRYLWATKRSLCNANTGGRGLMTILNSKLMECFQEGSEELRIVTGVATKAIGGNGNVIFMGSNAVE